MTARRRPIAIDLFAGCGGLTTGLKRAGFRVVAAIDNDRLAARTYKRNHPRVWFWQQDIRRLPAAHVLRKLKLKKGRLDLLAGCPPCQGFSALRRLNGGRYVRDGRNSLVLEFLRYVRVLRPKLVLMENVPRLGNYWRMGAFRKEIRRLGYLVQSGVLDAADFGVPQRRRRFILAASRIGEPGFGAKTQSRVTVRAAIGQLGQPGRTGDPAHDITERRQDRIERLIRRIPPNGGSRSALHHKQRLRCHTRSDGFKDVYGRMAWDDVAPTITGGCVSPSKGRFLHPSQHRCITIREAAALQGFPATYFIDMSCGKFPAAQMIGNALPPEFVRVQAAALRSLLSRSRRA